MLLWPCGQTSLSTDYAKYAPSINQFEVLPGEFQILNFTQLVITYPIALVLVRSSAKFLGIFAYKHTILIQL